MTGEMNWEEWFRELQAANERKPRDGTRASLLIGRAAARLGGDAPAQQQWLAEALSSHQGIADPKFRAALDVLTRARRVPKPLFNPLMKALVNEQDVSHQQWYVAPARQAPGARAVLEALLAYLRSGNSREKQGAVKAFYWVMGAGNLKELREHARRLMLDTFLQEEDPALRRTILVSLPMERRAWAPELQPRFDEVLKIARSMPPEILPDHVRQALGLT